MDGAYVGGKVRPENKKEDRVDRRLVENQDPDRRCILVMRQAHSEAEVKAGNAGAKKTLTFIVKNENQADIGKLAPAYIAQRSLRDLSRATPDDERECERAEAGEVEQ